MKLPVILCANKADLAPDVEAEEEMMPIMAEFKVWKVSINHKECH